MQKMDALVKLHTVQMEGNPVWSSTEYAYHLVTSLPELKILDQQEVAADVKANAAKWKQNQVGNSHGGASGARKQLLKKMEERNVSISNAKDRWNFLKKQSWKGPDDEDAAAGGRGGEEEQEEDEEKKIATEGGT